jgi:hypothetical protein
VVPLVPFRRHAENGSDTTLAGLRLLRVKDMLDVPLLAGRPQLLPHGQHARLGPQSSGEARWDGEFPLRLHGD